jgi:hypothetical protein
VARLSLRRIATTSIVLALIAAAGIAWIARHAPSPGLPPMSAPQVDAPIHGGLDLADWARTHDVAVLRSVLDLACDGPPGSALLVAEPIDHSDRRTSTHPRVPALPDCPGIEIVAQARIAAAYDRAGPSVTHLPGATPGWVELLRDFPRAERVFQVSLPVYALDGSIATVAVGVSGSCLHCLSGREYTLTLRDGTWVVTGNRTTFIS